MLQLLLRGKEDAILSFQPDEQLSGRIEELAGKCNEGELSPEELAEYEGYIRANGMAAIIRRHARKMKTLQVQ